MSGRERIVLYFGERHSFETEECYVELEEIKK